MYFYIFFRMYAITCTRRFGFFPFILFSLLFGEVIFLIHLQVQVSFLLSLTNRAVRYNMYMFARIGVWDQLMISPRIFIMLVGTLGISTYKRRGLHLSLQMETNIMYIINFFITNCTFFGKSSQSNSVKYFGPEHGLKRSNFMLGPKL